MKKNPAFNDMKNRIKENNTNLSSHFSCSRARKFHTYSTTYLEKRTTYCYYILLFLSSSLSSAGSRENWGPLEERGKRRGGGGGERSGGRKLRFQGFSLLKWECFPILKGKALNGLGTSLWRGREGGNLKLPL